jgi:hypothetical protein
MRLLPHDASFFAHFEHQGKKTVEGCRAFLEMVEQPTDLEARAKRVKQIEHECDEITHAVVEGLHKTFITPIDRNDIYTLITKMDDIMDFVEAAADRLALYEIGTMTWPAAWSAAPSTCWAPCRASAISESPTASFSTASRSTGWRTSPTASCAAPWRACSARRKIRSR